MAAQNVDNMIDNNTVFKLVIPRWKNKVPIGTVQKQYYSKSAKLPLKHKGAKLKKFGRSKFYIDNKGKKIVKNPLKAGNPKYWNLNGQQFYSTNMHWSNRTIIRNFYHSYFKKYINKGFKEPFPIFLEYRIEMNVVIYDLFSNNTPDITNMWILAKMFEDVMVSEKILRDDSPQFRSKTSYEYKFVENESKRKLIIEFKYKKI